MSTQASPTKPHMMLGVRFSDSVPLMCQRYTGAFPTNRSVRGASVVDKTHGIR